MSMKKRLLSLILALFMAASLLPLSTLAVEPEDPAEPVAVEETVPEEPQQAEEETTPLQEEEEEVPEPETAAETEVEETEPVSAAGEGEGTATEPAPDAQVWMTVSTVRDDKAVLALARATVTVKDLDADGVLTFDEALKAAHEAYCPGGYETSTGEWEGQSYVSVEKLWGVSNYGSYLFYRNDALADSVNVQTVSAGDDLVAAVMKDTVKYSDQYGFFTAKTLSGTTDDSFDLTLKFHSYEKGSYLPAAGASVGTWTDGTFTALDGKTTDADGRVSLTFSEPGTYVVSASGTVTADVTDWDTGTTVTMDCPLTAPICVITVEAAEQPAESGHIIVSFEMFDAETNTVALITDPEKVAFAASDNGKTIAEKLLGAENVDISNGWMKSFTIDDVEYSAEELGMTYGSWLVYKNNAQDSVGPADYKPTDGDVYRFVLTSYDPITYAMPEMPNDLSALYWTVAEYTGNKAEVNQLIQKEGGASQAEIDAMTVSLATPGGSHYVFIDGRTVQVNTTTNPFTYFTTLTADRRSAAEGTTVTVTVTAPDGTALVPGTLKANGTALTAGEENTYTFTMPDAHVTVTADFEYTVKLLSAAFSYDMAGEETIDLAPAFDPDTYEYEIVLAENRLPKNTSTFYFTADFDESATAKWFVYMNMNGSGTYTGANAVTPGTPVALRKSNFLVYGGRRHVVLLPHDDRSDPCGPEDRRRDCRGIRTGEE